MKAYIASHYGGPEVLVLHEINEPHISHGQMRIKLKAISVNSGDARLRSLNVPGPFKLIMRLSMGWKRLKQPILGVAYAGVVEAITSDNRDFQIGDRVIGHLGLKTGTYSEKIVVDIDSIVSKMPNTLTYNDAAAIPFGGITAQYFLKKVSVNPNHQVMVYGAAGAVGSMAIQILKNQGYHSVTAVAKEHHHGFLQQLGADRTLDYRQNEFKQDTEQYDLIFDAVGKLPKEFKKTKLKANGKFLTVGGFDIVKEKKEDLEELLTWYRDGKLQAVIDSEFSFSEMVAAHQYLDTQTKRGSIVVIL